MRPGSAVQWFTLLASMLFLATPIVGQGERGLVSGIVLDETERPVAGARLTLLNESQGLQREAKSNVDGTFSFPLLHSGIYVLTAQSEGFSVSEIQGIELASAQVAKLRVVLRVASQALTVRVTQSADELRSERSFPNEEISGDALRNAPASSGDITSLALLLPGVAPEDGERNTLLRYHIAGARSDSITFLLDGGFDNNLLDNLIAYKPQLDAIEQVRILVSNYSAQYGRNSGGIVTITTRSGSTEWHGSAFDFLQNTALDANSFFNKIDLLPREFVRQNQFGLTLGGLLQSRHATSGRQKLFFFVAYQGTRSAKTLTVRNITTFTPEEMSGDFSRSAGGSPDAGVATFLESTPYFQPSPSKAAIAIIDPLRISSVASAYFKLGLLPVSSSGKITSNGRKTVVDNQATLKLDWNPGDRDRFSATAGLNNAQIIEPFAFANVNGFPARDRLYDGFGRFSYVRTFSPRVVGAFSLTENLDLHALGEPMRMLPTAGDLGVNIAADSSNAPPNISFSSGLSIGFPQNSASNYSSSTLGGQGTVSIERSAHLWTLGGGVSDFHNNTKISQLADGEFASDGTTTFNDLADFLIGAPSAYWQGPNAPLNVQSKFFDAFAEDVWAVRSNLHVTLGLRYEYSTPKSDTQNRLFSILPGHHSNVYPSAPVGMVFRSDPGVPEGVNFPDRDNWGPRLGIAWSPGQRSRTTIRAGFGLFYDILKAEDNLQFEGQSPFFSNSALYYSSPPFRGGSWDALAEPYRAAGARDPFPSRDLSRNVNFLADGFLPIGGTRNVFVVDPHLHTPETYQYSLSIAREVGSGDSLEFAYVHTHSAGLTALTDIDPMALGTYDRVLNLSPGNSTCGFNAPDLTCSFASVREFKNLGWARYNGESIRWQRRSSHSDRWGDAELNVSYTFARSRDNASGFTSRNADVPYYTPNQFAASSDFDIRQRVVASASWTLPLATYLPSVPVKLVQGWNVYPIFTWRTGFPLDILASLPSIDDYTSPGPSGAGDAQLVRANVVGPIRLENPRRYQSMSKAAGNFWFDPSSFSNAQCQGSCQAVPGLFPSDAQVVANPGLRTYGSLPRNYLRGPGRTNVDLAVSKTLLLTGSLALEIRADFFNLLNHAEFFSPNTNINDPSFGQVQDTAEPRLIQIGVRFKF